MAHGITFCRLQHFLLHCKHFVIRCDGIGTNNHTHKQMNKHTHGEYKYKKLKTKFKVCTICNAKTPEQHKQENANIRIAS